MSRSGVLFYQVLIFHIVQGRHHVIFGDGTVQRKMALRRKTNTNTLREKIDIQFFRVTELYPESGLEYFLRCEVNHWLVFMVFLFR